MTASLVQSQRMGLSQVSYINNNMASRSSFHYLDSTTMTSGIPNQRASVTNRIILFGAIITLSNLADIIHKSSRIYLFQQAQCLLYYNNVDPTKIQPDFRIEERFCKVSPIQSRLATFDGIDSFLNCLPRG